MYDVFTWINQGRAGPAGNTGKDSFMRRLKRSLFLIFTALAGVSGLYVVFHVVFLDFVVDLWWFRALGYEGYLWLRIVYRYVIFVLTVVLSFAVFFCNFWIASRYLGVGHPAHAEGQGGEKIHRDLLGMFRSASLKVYAPLSALLSVFIAIPLFREWEKTLLYIFAPHSGVKDPVYHGDISYYLFSLPIHNLVRSRLLIIFGFLTVATLILYWLEKRAMAKADRRLPLGARVHVSVLVLLFGAVQVWGYMLDRYALLYSQAYQPLFYGPGYTEMKIELPLIWLGIVFLAAFAVSAVLLMVTKRTGKKVLLCVALAGGWLLVQGLRQSDYVARQVQKYIVEPNEVSRQSPFIENNIQATLAAYGLTKVKLRDYAVQPLPWSVETSMVRENLRNIPVWDAELLGDVYEQLQGIRPYYDFQGIHVDRYTVNGRYQQVYLAARELNLEKLPAHAKNWINRRLQYTHGFGLVMTPAAQGGDEIITWFLQDIPPRSDYGVEVEEPRIYYGLGSYGYIVAPNEVGEMDYPQSDTNITVDYEGKGGVPLSSVFRKILFSVYFKDRNLLFTTKTNNRSRLLFHRNIRDRIRKLTPFFLLDGDPYVVVTAKGTFWIQDAYTVSDRYPASMPSGRGFNYIRNAAKVVVDAFNGTVTYYMADPSDPIVRAYQRMYPGLLKPLEDMPSELKAHIRYPRDLFSIQMTIYAKYHQKDPDVFYREEDLWEFPKIYDPKATVHMKPYYVTLNLIDRDRSEFLLLSPMSPKGRDNLRALVVAGCDGKHYGELVVYSFPKGMQVYGPSQIDALIDQDTTIAEQFTLWNQVGSEVRRGKMIILPIGEAVVYIQPVYLRAAGRLKIPELKRLIMSQGDTVVMDKSLEQAFDHLEAQVRAQMQRREKRFRVDVETTPDQENQGDGENAGEKSPSHENAR